MGFSRQEYVSDSVGPYGLRPVRLLCPWDSPGKNTGVGCHALFRGIFPTQGSNRCLLLLLHWQECYHSCNQRGTVGWLFRDPPRAENLTGRGRAGTAWRQLWTNSELIHQRACSRCHRWCESFFFFSFFNIITGLLLKLPVTKLKFFFFFLNHRYALKWLFCFC